MEEEFIWKHLGTEILNCDGNDRTDGEANINENGHPMYDKRGSSDPIRKSGNSRPGKERRNIRGNGKVATVLKHLLE